MSSLLGTMEYCNEYAKTLFNNSNDNGRITLDDFIIFSIRSKKIWEPLFELQNAVRSKFMKDFDIILTRKLNIDKIKYYKKTHNNKDPSKPCSKLFSHNPYHYDFDLGDIKANFTDIALIFIGKYNKLRQIAIPEGIAKPEFILQMNYGSLHSLSYSESESYSDIYNTVRSSLSESVRSIRLSNIS